MAEWIEFEESSALDGGSYDLQAQTLTIRFKSGKTYCYYNVPLELG